MAQVTDKQWALVHAVITPEFHKMQGVRLAENWLVSQGLCSMEWVSK